MATSGSISTNVYHANNGTMGVKLSWSLKSQSIENNTSTIAWTVKSYGTYPKDSWIYCYSLVVKLNGSNLINKTSRFEMKGNGGYKKTGTITVAHNADGKKTFSMSIRAAIYSSSVNCTASGTGTPNTINRYALLSSVEDFTDEVGTNGYPTIVYTNPAGTTLTTGLKARITWNSGADYTDWVTLNDEGGTYTFTSSTLTSANISSMLSSCTTANTLAVQYDLQSTMGGTDYHSYKDATMTVVNADPTPQSLSYLDVNSTTTEKTGSSSIIVQNQSTLRIQTTPSVANKSATITSYNLNINNNDYTPTISGGYVYVDFVNPSLSGTFLATMTTTDSRGNTAVATTNVIVQPWEPPTALFTLSRVNGFYTDTILYVDASMSSVSNTNSMTIRERHKKVGESTWSTATTIRNRDNTTIALDNADAWTVRILVADEYTTTAYAATVGKGVPIMFIDKDKNSIGVNGYPDANNQIYVDGTIKSTGMITAPSMSVQDISSEYTITKTSGNWKVNDISAFRMGNVVHIVITFGGNGSAVSAGSNGFVGTITNGPKPALATKLVAFYNNAPIVLNINPDGAIAARVTAVSVTITTSGTMIPAGTFITND